MPEDFFSAYLSSASTDSGSAPPPSGSPRTDAPPPPSGGPVDFFSTYIQTAEGELEAARRRKLEELQAAQVGGNQQAQQLGLDQPPPGALDVLGQTLGDTGEQLAAVGMSPMAGAVNMAGGLGRTLQELALAGQRPGVPPLGQMAAPVLDFAGDALAAVPPMYQQYAGPAETRRQEIKQEAPVAGFVADVAEQVPQILGAAAVGGGAPALALLGASAAGQGIQQAEAEGATPAEAVAYGTASGLIEAGTERIGTIPLVDKILKRAIVGPVVKPGAIKRVLKDIGANFGEEVAATVGNELAALATYQQEVSPDLLQKTVYSGLVGAGLGGLVSGGTEVANRIGTPAPQQAPPPQMPPPVVEAPPVQEAAPVVAEPVQVPIVEPLPLQPEVVPQAPPAAVVQTEPPPPRKRKAGPSPAELDQLQAEAAPVEQAPAQPTAPTAAPPVPTVVPQEAQNGEGTQADVAEARRPAPDQISVAPEAGRPAPAAVLEETPDALRRQEGRQEGREAVAPIPAQPVAEPTPSPAPAEPIAIESTPESGRAGTPKGSGIVAGAATEEVKGMASTSSVPYMKMPVNLTAPPAAPSEPLGTQGVLAGLNKIWDVPIRFRHFRKKAQAIFKTRPEVVRMKDAGDLPASAHEIAHYIDKTRPGLIQGAHKAATTELITLGKRLYSTGQHTLDFYKSEGFAEYVRHRLTRDDAAQEAPEFDLYFNGAVAGDAELSSKLSQSKGLYDQWRGQAPIQRAKGQIDFDQKLGKMPVAEKVREIGRKTIDYHIDSWAPVDRYTKAILEKSGKTRESLLPKQDPYQLLVAFQGSEASVARQMMLKGVRDAEGSIIADSIQKAMSGIKAKDWRDFFAYALAKRTIELEPKGKQTGLDIDDAKAIVAQHESPEWIAAAKSLNSYANGLVDILQESGALTAEQATKIKESEWYIPLTRVWEVESGGRLAQDYPGKKKQAAGTGTSPIEKMSKEGSQRPIQDPMLSLAQLTERVVNASLKARVFRAVYALQEGVEGVGDIIEEVDAPKVPQTFTLERIQKQLEDLGIDVPSTVDAESLLTIFTNSAFPVGADPIVSGVVDGKRKFLYVKDPMLYNSLANLPPPWLEATKMLWPLRKLAAGVRLGATGVNLGFGLITNPLRDIRDGVLKTLKAPPSYLVRTVRSAGPQTDVDRLFMAGGGEMATRVGVDIRQFRKLRREIAAQTKPEVVKMHLLHSIDWIRDVVAFTETYGRRGEFRAVYEDVLQKTGDKESAWIAAQAAASDVTTNFRRAGVYGRFLNQIIPFYNAAIQGTNNLTIAARRNPTKFAMTALASLTVPQLALWALHRDDEWYQELPIWEKALFTHLKIGNQVIRIPLPFEAGFVFATMPVAILDYYRNKDKKRFDDIMGTAFDSLLPPAAVPGIKEYYEWNANLNTLTGQPIESQRLESLLPEDRFYETTSEVYRKIGKMAGMSPVKIENTVVGLTGGLSRNFTDPFKARKVQEAADIPVLGRLFSRQNRTGQSVSDIYEESSAAEEAYASILKALDESKPERIAKLEEKYRDLIGFNADGPLEKGNTRERYPRLYLLRDAKKLLKEAKGLDDPKMATKVARIMLGRDRLEDLPEEERKALKKAFTFPQGVK